MADAEANARNNDECGGCKKNYPIKGVVVRKNQIGYEMINYHQ